VGLQDLTRRKIVLVLDTAAASRPSHPRRKKGSPLRGQTLVNFFVEASTRTRSQLFELARPSAQRDVINSPPPLSSLTKERLSRTRRRSSRPTTPISSCSGTVPPALAILRTARRQRVINAGDGAHEHPTQALLDTFTIRRNSAASPAFTSPSSATPVQPRRPFRTSMPCSKLGRAVTLVGPSTLVPREFEQNGRHGDSRSRRRAARGSMSSTCCASATSGSAGILPSLGEYTALFWLTKPTRQRLKPEPSSCIPGPVNRAWRSTAISRQPPERHS